MLKGILFDYSGTVLISDSFDIEGGLHAAWRSIGLEKSKAMEITNFAIETELVLQEIRDGTVLEFTFQQLFTIVIDYFGLSVECDISQMEAVYYNAALSYKPAPGIETFLKKIKPAGIKTAIISNSTHGAGLINREIRRAGLAEHFNKVMSSADYGIRKQCPLLYQIALHNLGLEPSETVFVGDNLQFDIATAQFAGLAAVWYNWKGIDNSTDICPDLVFDDWSTIDVDEFDMTLGDRK